MAISRKVVQDEIFRVELETLINRHSKENGSDTPDFILAEYLMGCLEAFDKAMNQRTKWHNNEDLKALNFEKG